MINFLCTRCRACMCPDCLEIADEYHELERNRARNQFLAERDNFRLKQELEQVQKDCKCGKTLPNSRLQKLYNVGWRALLRRREMTYPRRVKDEFDEPSFEIFDKHGYRYECWADTGRGRKFYTLRGDENGSVEFYDIDSIIKLLQYVRCRL